MKISLYKHGFLEDGKVHRFYNIPIKIKVKIQYLHEEANHSPLGLNFTDETAFV